MGVVIRQIVIDCIDPEAVAAFWAATLGWHVHREESYLWSSESGDEDSFGLVLVFVAVPEVKTVKNRLHLDLAVTNSTQDNEVERLIALGARRIDVGQEDTSWVVLADPEGNEFCVETHDID